MNKTKRSRLVLALLAVLVLLTACDTTVAPPALEDGYVRYENSRTAAVFSGLKNGKIKILFTADVWDRTVTGSFYADLGSNQAQIHAVRNSYDVYQRDEGTTCYTLDVNEKVYTETASGSDGALGVAKLLTTGGNGVLRQGTRAIYDPDKKYYYEDLYDGDDWVATCYFDGAELKYIWMKLMGNGMLAQVDSMTFSFDSSEMNISGFPDQYTKVDELKRLNDLMNRYS